MALLSALASFGCDTPTAGARDEPSRSPRRTRPELRVHKIDHTALCVTRGRLAGSRIDAATFRAVALGDGGDATGLKMIVRGDSAEKRALASGQLRRQVGLKLRAQDGCNLVYVMWRLDPKPMLEVSIKRNPGQRAAEECGAGGYTKVKPAATRPLPDLLDGTPHELRAEIIGDSLVAWVDGEVAWNGELPAIARELSGPSGLRSDNLDVEIVGFSVGARSETGTGDATAKCVAGYSD